MTSKTDTINPYLFFDGRCEEAIEFYRKALGAEVLMISRFKDAPPDAKMQCAANNDNKVMHATLRIGQTNLLVSDGQCGGAPHFAGFSLSLTAANPAEAEKWFKALSDGGKVTMPLTKTFFSPSFGMTTDRFGVPWMVYVQGMQS